MPDCFSELALMQQASPSARVLMVGKRGSILFSYETAVALHDSEAKCAKTTRVRASYVGRSKTTSRHISEYLGDPKMAKDPVRQMDDDAFFRAIANLMSGQPQTFAD